MKPKQNIKKCKYKDGETLITTIEYLPNDAERETSLKCKDEPAPTFKECFTDLAPMALSMIKAPDAWKEYPASVTGVSFAYQDDKGMGAVITLLVTLPDFNSPLVINTPYACEDTDENGNGSLLPDDVIKTLYRITDEAFEYLNGKRAQIGMFDDAEQTEEAA